jgi:PTH1 family peptidyl-tRNA hydrolase
VRAKGSHGGQKGLLSIQEHLGTDAYTRLRIGVGQPEQGDAVDFVLSKFRPAERKVAEDSVALAGQAVLVWARSGTEACMNRFNGPGDDEKKKPKKQAPGREPGAGEQKGSDKPAGG